MQPFLLSVSFIREVYVFGDFVFGSLAGFIVTWSGHSGRHCFLTVGETNWERRLLSCTLDLGPLGSCNSLWDVVWSWPRICHFRDHPGTGALWRRRFSKWHSKSPWFCQLNVGIGVSCRWNLHGKPFLVLSKMNPGVLAAKKVKQYFDQAQKIEKLRRKMKLRSILHEI